MKIKNPVPVRQKTVKIYDPDNFHPTEKKVPNQYIYALTSKQMKYLRRVIDIFIGMKYKTQQELHQYNRLKTIIAENEYETRDQHMLNQLMKQYRDELSSH